MLFITIYLSYNIKYLSISQNLLSDRNFWKFRTENDLSQMFCNRNCLLTLISLSLQQITADIVLNIDFVPIFSQNHCSCWRKTTEHNHFDQWTLKTAITSSFRCKQKVNVSRYQNTRNYELISYWYHYDVVNVIIVLPKLHIFHFCTSSINWIFFKP